ncbi:MAG: hypothetical protein PHI35_07935, partial [Victivallaceae bacterium]|nr:hypothetical protein [Victivallaceae bacterium]
CSFFPGSFTAAAGKTEAPDVVKTPTAPTDPAADKFKLAAVIRMIAPEPGTRLAPIDLAEFEARAESNAPWSGFWFQVSVNGDEPQKHDFTAPPRVSDETTFVSDAIDLAGLDVKPYDLVTLQVSGISAGVEVLSNPVYWRIKPLRNEVLIIDQPGGGAQALIDEANAFMEREIELAELLTSGRNLLAADPKVPAEPFGQLAASQRELAAELRKYLETERDRPGDAGRAVLTPLMYKLLSEAASQMDEAGSLINRLPPSGAPLAAAAMHQRKAIAALASAMREVRKAYNRNQDKSGIPSPSSGSPEKAKKLLEQALSLELALIEKVKAAPGELPPGVAGEQKAINDLAELITHTPQLADPALKAAAEGLDAGRRAEQAAESAAPKAFPVFADQAAQAFRRGLESMRIDSESSFGQAADEAREKLAQAEKKSAAAPDSPPSKEARNDMAKAAAALRRAAAAKPGENGGNLSQLADRVEQLTCENTPGREAANKLRDIRAELGKLENKGGDTPAETAQQLDKLTREAAFHNKNGDWKSAAGWRNDLERAAEAALRHQTGDSPSFPRDAAEALRDLARDFSPNHGLNAVEFQRLQELTRRLKLALESTRDRPAAHNVFYSFSPDRIAPEYREPAAAYFERLSKPQTSREVKP